LERKEIDRKKAESEAEDLKKKLELWKGLNSFVQRQLEREKKKKTLAADPMDWSKGRPNFTDFVEKNMENLQRNRETDTLITAVKNVEPVPLQTTENLDSKINEIEK